MDLIGKSIFAQLQPILQQLEGQPVVCRIETINAIRQEIHRYSPFANEPVDCVLWIPSDEITANDYNPNAVAPPEMKLLEHSIAEDGYTQPIVGWYHDDRYEVIDGFHRHRVGKESKTVQRRVHGHLPIAVINGTREDRSDRIAATIRHNRARGKHKVEAMSDIVIELKRRNWSDERIGKELGMDPDEVLRLCQITGLAEVFAHEEFSKSWDIEHLETETVGDEMLSDVDAMAERSESGRIHHTWDKWECYRSGFYDEQPPGGMTQDEGEEKYRKFLGDYPAFEYALQRVTDEWTFSCEHYLTNERMNRIAWLGQASVAYALGIPSMCRGGYNRLAEEQKRTADELALKYLNIWLERHGNEPVPYEQALSRTQAELY